MSAEPEVDRLPQANTGTAGNQPNPNIKHPLQNSWTFWYKQPNAGKASDWSKNLVEIVKVETVEDFWALINNVKDPSTLNNNSSYMLFKSSSEPKWEHQDNADGFCITIPIPPKTSLSSLINDMWEEVLMVLIGEQLGPLSEFINGAWVNIRGRGNRFEIWLKKAIPEGGLNEMAQSLKNVLTEAPSLQDHAQAFKIQCTRLGGQQILFEC